MEDSSAAEYEILELVHPMSSSADPAATFGSFQRPSAGQDSICSVIMNYRTPGDPTLRSQEGTGLSASTPDSNTTMTQPGTSSPAAVPAYEGHELDSFLGKAFEEKPIWKDLYESIRDVFFPPKLPPLELTSTPIPVPDLMAVKTNPWAVGTATFINGAILAIILFLGARAVIKQIEKPKLDAMDIDVGAFKAPKAANLAGGGGGGGAA